MTTLIGAGYLVARRVARSDWMGAALLPARVLSASTCISPHFPGSYALDWSGDSDARRAGV